MANHDVTIPTIELSLTTDRVLRDLEARLLGRVEDLRVKVLYNSLTQIALREPRLCFLAGELKDDLLSVRMKLGTNTIQHLSLIEQVMVGNDTSTMESTPIEKCTLGKLVRRVIIKTMEETTEHLFEFTITPEKDNDVVELHFPSPLQLSQPTHPLQLTFEFDNTMEQFKDVLRLDPKLLDIFKPTHSIVAHATSLPFLDAGQARTNFNSFLQREVTLLSALAIHLREGFRPSELTSELELPTNPSVCSISKVRKILGDLQARGLVTYLSDMSIPHLTITIPKSLLVAAFSSKDMNSSTLSFITYFPINSSRATEVLGTESTCPEEDLKGIDERIQRDLSLISSCNARLQRSSVLQGLSRPFGFAAALQDVSDCSDFLYGVGWRARPKGGYDPGQDPNLESCISELIVRAGPETVRNAAEASLLGRVRLE